MTARPTNRLDDDVRLIAVTQKQMAQALGLSRTRINNLVDEGILVRDETARNGQLMLFESLQNWFLSRNTADDSETANFWKERGLHEKAKRELAEVKLAKTRGELYESRDVEQVLSELLTNFRSKITGLPSKLAPRLQKKNRAEINRLLTAELDEILLELSAGLESVTFEITDETQADSGEVNPSR